MDDYTNKDHKILTDFGIANPQQTQQESVLTPFEVIATATLYAIENQQMLEEHFEEFIRLIREKLQDDDFIARIKALKGRGRITEAVRLPKEDSIFRFIDRIWFKIERTQSMYYAYYHLSYGVNLRKDELNPFTFQKIYINNMVCGELEKIIGSILADDFALDAKERLTRWVYKCCEKDFMETFG